MKHIFVNLKRFEIPSELGGINRLAPVLEWAEHIVKNTQDALDCYSPDEVEFVDFFPESHIINAVKALKKDSRLGIGCQGIYRENVAPGGNFGAFTTNRPASSMTILGVGYTLIGHCEERTDKKGILAEAGVTNTAAVNRLLNKEVKIAIENGMKVLYCIGESAEEQEHWADVIREQLEVGLDGVDKSKVVIGYEPIWSIGPGRVPADKAYITKIARFVKEVTGGIDVVYGGGLKYENAEMLASIEEINGGLIGLTKFTDDFGFYPDGYIEIVKKYLGK